MSFRKRGSPWRAIWRRVVAMEVLWRQRFVPGVGPNPGVRQNLAATPASLTEKELPKLRHVARAQLEVAPTVVVTARVRRPPNVMNTERFKKRLARECQGVCPRSLCQNDGQHMWI